MPSALQIHRVKPLAPLHIFRGMLSPKCEVRVLTFPERSAYNTGRTAMSTNMLSLSPFMKWECRPVLGLFIVCAKSVAQMNLLLHLFDFMVCRAHARMATETNIRGNGRMTCGTAGEGIALHVSSYMFCRTFCCPGRGGSTSLNLCKWKEIP
jgi:hypothetical protein